MSKLETEVNDKTPTKWSQEVHSCSGIYLFAPTDRKSMVIINVTIKALTIKVTVILRTPNSQNIYGHVWIAALQAAWVPGTPNWMHGSEDGARQSCVGHNQTAQYCRYAIRYVFLLQHL